VVRGPDKKNATKGLRMTSRGNQGGHDNHDEQYGGNTLTQGTSAFPPTGESAATQQSTANVARDEAANVGQSTRAAAADVTGTAADQARNVVQETRREASDLLGEARSQAREQASAQQRKAAQNLHTLAGQLNEMAAKSGDSGTAAQLAEEASNRVHRVASWLERREPADLLDEVRDFARRRPGTFLLGAALAGVLAGRMTRGATAAVQSGQPEPRQSGGASADVPDVAQPAGTGPVPPSGPVPTAVPSPRTGPETGYGSDPPGTGYGRQNRGAEVRGDYSYRPGQP
jgi:hypothetical protein